MHLFSNDTVEINGIVRVTPIVIGNDEKPITFDKIQFEKV